MADWIAVIDFGSQLTQLIVRRVRELRVYSEVFPCTADIGEILARNPSGIILSGGPASVYQKDAPQADPRILASGKPILGICYGFQALCHALGGKVCAASEREFGRATFRPSRKTLLFEGLPDELQVWMSHGDRIEALPEGFTAVGSSENSPFAAVESAEKRIYGVLFHPEVAHTPLGIDILKNFVYKAARCQPSWKMLSFVEEEIDRIRSRVGDKNVILGLSGGVDSATLAALLSRAIGKQLHCIFVDTGLLRAGERDEVAAAFGNGRFNLTFHVVDAGERFLRALRGVSDPEQKRKIIGRMFIEVFRGKSFAIEDAAFLAQGTLYPDVIESISPRGGPSAVIKSHHNVGGLPEKIGFELLEPFRFLFKDEVREIAKLLHLPEPFIKRHPFPGPGLAVRILGEITPERIALVQKADKIFLDEIRAAGLYDRIWQAFAALLPVKSVGVMGDERTYECTCALRAVTSTDGMTADWAQIPYEVLGKVSNRIINEVRGINRVVYDISSKPPATIEWE